MRDRVGGFDLDSVGYLRKRTEVLISCRLGDMARLLAALLLAVQSSSAFRYHVGSNRALGRPLYHNSLRSTVALQQPQHDESAVLLQQAGQPECVVQLLDVLLMLALTVAHYPI